jgi:hypothetical protein
MAFPWLLFIGISVTFSALQCKTRRVIKVMEAANTMRRVVLSPKDVMQELVVFVGGKVILNLCRSQSFIRAYLIQLSLPISLQQQTSFYSSVGQPWSKCLNVMLSNT